MALPDFLVVGAPKAGTTALHVALSQHPQIFMSSPKEPKYFLTDDGVQPVPRGGPGDAQTISRQVWRRADYEALFDASRSHALKGESSTLYLHDRAAHRRIAATLPDARLVAVLRDPVDRAHSNWTHLRSAGLEPERDFVRATEFERTRAHAGWAPFWRYLGLGHYGAQLEHLFSVFPREQVLVLFYRDLREQPEQTLDTLFRFLGVETGVVTDVPPANVTVASSHSLINNVLGLGLHWGARFGRTVPHAVRERVSQPLVRLLQREQRLRTPLLPDQRARLIPSFEDDIDRVEALLDVELPHWRDERYGTGRRMLPVTGRFGTGHVSIDSPACRRTGGQGESRSGRDGVLRVACRRRPAHVVVRRADRSPVAHDGSTPHPGAA